MKLPLDAKIELISKVASDFVNDLESGCRIPKTRTYKIASSLDGPGAGMAAREAAFKSLTEKPAPLTKLAFDTRRVDQENDRNPRTNLQYWHRSDPFIDDEDKKKIDIFARVGKVLNKLRDKLGTEPEWFESYARVLYDSVNRILRIKQADMDIFRPQLSYLEQLVYARYRLTMADLENFSEEKLSERILAKDENLSGKGDFMKVLGDQKDSPKDIVKDGLAKTTQESIVNAIFGANNLRRTGENSVERTITIKIVDRVID